MNQENKLQEILGRFDQAQIFHNQSGRDDRFAYAVAYREGKKVFIKHALSDEAQAGLRRERLWIEFMQHVADMYPESGLRGPVILDQIGLDTLVFEYIDAPQVADHHDVGAWQANMSRYAKMLHVIDEAGAEWQPSDGDEQLSRTINFYEVWLRWLGEYKTKVVRLDEAKHLVEKALPNLTTRMQHGDLTPWQIFAMGETWVIYDGERCGTDLPRYNDLAYGYGRLATKFHSPDLAKTLLTKHLELAGTPREEFMKDFLPIMVIRTIGMLADAFHDMPAGNNYIKEAEALLATCLDASDTLF